MDTLQSIQITNNGRSDVWESDLQRFGVLFIPAEANETTFRELGTGY